MKNTGHHNNGNGKAQAVIDDLDSLKEDSLDLAKDLQVKSEKAVNEVLDQMMKAGEDEAAKLEKRVTTNPLNSVLLAFTAGMFACYLLAPRR